MSIRNIAHSQDLKYDHGHNPRKLRSVAYSNQFEPTHFYKKQTYIPHKESKETSWVGKYFIPIGTTNNYVPQCHAVSEYEVMRKAGMYAYRILYAIEGSDGKVHIQSKAAMEGRPGQMNITLNTNNKILDVEYW